MTKKQGNNIMRTAEALFFVFVNVGFAFGAVHADGLAAAVIVALDVFVIVGGLLRLHGAGPDPYAELGS
jgi:hypothetical protein